MNQISSKDQFSYSIIPFAECVVSGRPIRTFVSSNQNYSIDIHIDTTKVIESKIKTSFTKEELSMSVTNYHKYIKDNTFSKEKILAFKLARRRYNNCIYAHRSREKKRKNKKTLLTNTINDSSIDDHVEQDEHVEQDVQVVQVVQDEYMEKDDQVIQYDQVIQDDQYVQVVQDDQDDQYVQVVQDYQDEQDDQVVQDEHEIIEDLPVLIHYTYISYIPYIPYIYT